MAENFFEQIRERSRAKQRVRDELFEDKVYVEILTDLLGIEADGGDDPAAFVQECLKEAWTKKKIFDESFRSHQRTVLREEKGKQLKQFISKEAP